MKNARNLSIFVGVQEFKGSGVHGSRLENDED
jgi:hypothetical protein